MGWILLAVLLFLLTAALVVAEVFVPSGGILSILALASAIGGVWIFFNQSVMMGWIGLVVAVLIIPTALGFAYKMLPHTSFGKSVLLAPPVRKSGDAIADNDRLQQLLGKTGQVITALRPVGTCEFDGERVECVAESGYVEKDNKVKVIRVEGTQLTVRMVQQS